jgi:hypothetical protein
MGIRGPKVTHVAWGRRYAGVEEALVVAILVWGCGPVAEPEREGSDTGGATSTEMETTGTSGNSGPAPDLEPPDPCTELDIDACESPCRSVWTEHEDEPCEPVAVGCFGDGSECSSDDDCRSWQSCEDLAVRHCGGGGCGGLDPCGTYDWPFYLPAVPPDDTAGSES